jgi:hypothetical protein
MPPRQNDAVRGAEVRRGGDASRHRADEADGEDRQFEVTRRQLLGGGLGLAGLALFGACGAPSNGFSLRQSTEGTRTSGGFTTSAAFKRDVGPGNLLVAIITRSTGQWVSTIGEVRDNQGNHWKQAVEFGGDSTGPVGPHGVDIWYCESAGGGNRPMVTATQLLFANESGSPVYNTGINMQLLEYSGCSGYELVDQIGQARITTTSVTVTSWHHLRADNELAISAIMGDMAAATVPSGWRSRVADTTQKFYVADNLDSGSSTGSSLGAAWTGLTGGTTGVAVVATFKPVGVASTAARLVQTTYTDSAIQQSGGSPMQISQAFPVNPAPGNTLIAVMNGSIYHPAVECGSVTSVTDTAGNTWVPLAASGRDDFTGINIQVWMCRSANGGATSLTVNFSNASQQLSCLLLELANVSKNLVVDSSNGGAGNFVGDSPNQVTSDAVSAGALAIAYRATFFTDQPRGPNVGWMQVMSDTTGANCEMLLSAPAGVLAAHWTGSDSGGLDILIVALRGGGATAPSA